MRHRIERTCSCLGAALVAITFSSCGNAGSSSPPLDPLTLAVDSYVAAIGNNDAQGVFAVSYPVSGFRLPDATGAQTEPSAATLPPRESSPTASEAALKETYKRKANQHQRRTAVKVAVHTGSGSARLVTVTYEEAGVGGQEELYVRNDADPSSKRWLIIVTLASVSTTPPQTSSQISVDGITTALSASGVIPVYPGEHQVAVKATGLLEGDTQLITASANVTASTSFSVALTPAARTSALSTLKSFFNDCTVKSDVSPPSCPQTIGDSGYTTYSHVKWSTIDDPTAVVDLKYSGGNEVTASGTWHMHLEADYVMAPIYGSVRGHGSKDFEGPFIVTMTWSGDSFPAAKLSR